MKRIMYGLALLTLINFPQALLAQKKTVKPKAKTSVAAKKKTPVKAKPAAGVATATAPFMLKGFAEGLPDDLQVMVMSANNPTFRGPSGKVKNGQFLLTGTLPGPGIYNVMLSNPANQSQTRYIDMFLDNEPSAIRFTGEAANFEVLEGPSLQAFASLIQRFGGSFDTLSRLQQRRQMPDANQDSIMREWDRIIARVIQDVPAFIAEHGNTAVAPFLLCTIWPVTNQMLDVVEGWMNNISPAAMKNDFGLAIKEYHASEKMFGYGQVAPDFVQNDPDGKPVSLKNFRGKYVLVDFWASWCGPCRRENPNVVNAFNKYGPKNFTVLGVSLDREKGKWVEAISQDGLAWSHVSDLGFWNNAVAKLYKVQSIPQNFVLDPEGKIIGKNLRGEELESFLERTLK